MYDVHEDISLVLATARVHKDAQRLQESLDDFIMNFADYSEWGDESYLREAFDKVSDLKNCFVRGVYNQSGIAVNNISESRLTQPMKAETDPV